MMPGPNSYTGDDVVELHLHGSRVVVHAVLEACRTLGARNARQGEFTLRAFVNGKMDLIQAEAVADLVGSVDGVSSLLATRQMRGDLSRTLDELAGSLEGVLAEWRAALDFPEHATGAGVLDAHRTTLEDCACKIQGLAAGARVGLHRDLSVVLCGAPNVGKSSLVNAWTGSERVLVDSAPGTTRDAVEVSLLDGPVRWSLWDTAGIREDPCEVEARGIALARSRIDTADCVVWMLVADDPRWPDSDIEISHLVVSKSDLEQDPLQREKLAAHASARGLEIDAWGIVQDWGGARGSTSIAVEIT